MTTTLYDLNRLSFKAEEKLLIDVNVLIYLQTGETKNYDKMWELAKRQNNELFITTLSISEFINHFVRTGYKQFCRDNYHRPEEFDFKRDYQKEKHFLDIYDNVIDTVETEIIPKMKVLDFKNEDLNDIRKLTQHMLDINDALYLKKAITEGFAIVTHDRDFFNIQIPEDVKIYSYNSR